MKMVIRKKELHDNPEGQNILVPEGSRLLGVHVGLFGGVALEYLEADTPNMVPLHLITGYGRIPSIKVPDGKNLRYITTAFHPITGTPATVFQVMDAVERTGNEEGGKSADRRKSGKGSAGGRKKASKKKASKKKASRKG